jgi:hypothetical protein
MSIVKHSRFEQNGSKWLQSRTALMRGEQPWWTASIAVVMLSKITTSTSKSAARAAPHVALREEACTPKHGALCNDCACIAHATWALTVALQAERPRQCSYSCHSVLMAEQGEPCTCMMRAQYELFDSVDQPKQATPC